MGFLAFSAPLPVLGSSTTRKNISGSAVCVANMAAQAPQMALEVGQKVRVAVPVIMYHFPGKRNQPTDVQGMEGTIISDISEMDGVPLSATAPFVVKFDDNPKFRAHFEESELEVL